MSDRLRIGMIGCGEIAVRTAEAIATAPSAQHAIVMDVDARVAADMAGTYGVPHTTRVEELLASPSVDAVYIAVPHHLHAPLALQAIAAGKHVLVEKPIATTLEDADRMIAAARERGVLLSVAFLAQGDAQLQRVRDLIQSGAIGKVVGTRIVLRADKPASYWTGGFTGRIQTDWRSSKARAGGGVLIMNTIHDLNTIRWLTGLEVTRVYAEYGTFATGVEVEDFVAVTCRYANGAIGTLEAGSAVRGRDPLREPDRIYGAEGQVLLSNPPRVYQAGEWRDVAPGAGARAPRTAAGAGFARAVLDGTPPPVSAEDGRAALEVVVAAYRAGEEARPVYLPLVTARSRS
jgi:UDP-N-acetyl-2-amino-2-deoxyglucuronate dehydrogenase